MSDNPRQEELQLAAHTQVSHILGELAGFGDQVEVIVALSDGRSTVLSAHVFGKPSERRARTQAVLAKALSGREVPAELFDAERRADGLT